LIQIFKPILLQKIPFCSILKYKIAHIKDSIETSFGKKIMYSKDCIELSEDIYKKIQVKISFQTLRRLFGFIKDGVKISNTSLHYLSLYCGYESFENFKDDYQKPIELVDDKDIKYIKLFFSIKTSSSQQDENYHNASKNIALLLFKNKALLNATSTFLSKNTTAQIYFFERFPFIDELSSGYALHLKKYLNEKKNAEAQLFGNCLLYFGYALSNNPLRSKIITIINSIELDPTTHPFPLGRKYACNILENYLNKNTTELERWIGLSIKEAININKRKNEFNNFPYFQFILSDVFNLIDRPNEAKEMIEICELDYKRVPDFTLDNGYLEALDLIKAINLVKLNKTADAKRILNRIKSTDIVFIMHDYFLIQRLLIELQLIKLKDSKKHEKLFLEIKSLIDKRKFYFFIDKLNSIKGN
jgi:hypothetical protein